MSVEVIRHNRLIIDGYVYKRDTRSAHRTFWNCISYKSDPIAPCSARASTSHISEIGKEVSVFRGPNQSPHSHPPDPEQVNMVRTQTVGTRPHQTNTRTKTDVHRKSQTAGSRKRPAKPRGVVTTTSTGNLPCYQEQSVQDNDSVSKFSVSQVSPFAFVDYDEYEVSEKVNPLSSSSVTSSVLSSPLANSSDVANEVSPSVNNEISPLITLAPESSTPLTGVVHLGSMQTDNVCHDTPPKRKAKTKRRSKNEELIKLLSSTIESTFRTMQQFSEIMAAKRDKKKKKRMKRDKSEKKPEKAEVASIVPSASRAIPMEDTASQSSSPIPKAILREESKELPVIDLTHDEDVKNGDVCIWSNIPDHSFESTIHQNSYPPNTLYSDPNHGLLDYDHPPSYEVTMNQYMARNHYNITSPMSHHFMYQSVTVQQVDTRIQRRDWTLNDMRIPLQNFRGDGNGFMTDLPLVAESYHESRLAEFSYGPVMDCNY